MADDSLPYGRGSGKPIQLQQGDGPAVPANQIGESSEPRSGVTHVIGQSGYDVAASMSFCSVISPR